MVDSATARLDIDNHILTKTVSYKYFSEVEDMAYGSVTRTSVTKDIKVQITIQNISSRYVRQGLLNAGDAIGVLRYEYDVDANGKSIFPVLIPVEHDEIRYLNRWYRIGTITPVTSEDDGIICWEFNASDITSEIDQTST